MTEETYMLVTRADFDGVVAGGLLIEQGLIGGDVVFVEPREVQKGEIEITERDITANLPYQERAHLCFDHHLSETERIGAGKNNHVIDPNSPSAARVVYDFYGGQQAFPHISEELMEAVDKADSAQYTESEVLAPQGWTLLNFIMDPRTGLAKAGRYSVSNNQLMKDMMLYCRRHSIEEILAIPDVEERVHLFWEHEEYAEEQLKKCSSMAGDVVVADLRGEEKIYACNRFLIYGLFPSARVSITVLPGDDEEKVLFAVGRSILNRGSKANIGSLMLEHGGAGHEAVGTCQVGAIRADDVLMSLVERINADG